ncbi:type II toxin-antitoxin system HipA family toxin (plasmid) [Diaphorobacter sp. HDW4B]|uniref:type II toxin-antitoxin system HipA family toxin n=1 Tax=Diaphorobacter sp. HDW4B TaxID=2714925 RepID=UPI001407E2C9|nr:type II toxin-antitoxin system HipA family toxin [Diaphorobacter sp. HDW4B]QIL74135.1 type II toxin-antitoxin system HipA family toxin [Diaphorobacter sp. HDW4B]
MDLSILQISMAGPDGKPSIPLGLLFRYGADQPNGIVRFIPGTAYIRNPDRPVLSLLFTGDTEEESQRLLADFYTADFNGLRADSGKPGPNGLHPLLLPAWFQNLLPEGTFREHIAQIRGCDVTNHFELLAACGADLPGAVYALPYEGVTPELMQTLVTNNQDALEVSVVETPLVEGISLSGVQPKLGVNEDSKGRYVARTKLSEVSHIIAKLPVVDYPRMPEVEHLSMELARMAGVDACQTRLVPLEKLLADHVYDLGSPDERTTMFLAVPRYDRDKPSRVHAEDMAQVLGFLPHEKYTTKVSYSLLMQVFMGYPSLGEAAVLELLRRLAVNELIGNADCHLKNIGVYYPNGVDPELPPAYDIVAHHVFNGAQGHALYILPERMQKDLEARQFKELERKHLAEHDKPMSAAQSAAASKLQLLRPSTLKVLAEEVQLPYKLLQTTVDKVVTLAARTWPAAIDASELTAVQKTRMKSFLEGHPAVQAVRRRQSLQKTKSL